MATNKNNTHIWRNLAQGRIFLTLNFFKKYWIYALAFIVFMLMYISNKYMCQNHLQQVMKLRVELDNARTDCVTASAKYNSMIRESQMKNLVDTMHLGLTSPDQPPYKLFE
ncbi:MAG: hypothetical protein II592_08245 [Muribaculaceae bacterium]|nr:hypothetical protein [Muribaculaceae bacterium]MBQ3959415.1 hypothetical protein [Muribaculaceae bacterium]MBQ4139509.1 hypothetical protein [Muribaculaceae bacterium]